MRCATAQYTPHTAARPMLSQDQTHFLLECVKFYMNDQKFSFDDEVGNVILSYDEIQQLIEDLKERKF